MELKREQIVKALECWIKNFDGKLKDFKTLCEALALIRELTKEVATLRLSESSYKTERERIWRQNDDLVAELAKSADENVKLGIKNFDLICELSRIKEETVRKMQEEARQMCFVVGDEEYVTLCDLDQIAKELLEEGSDDA